MNVKIYYAKELPAFDPEPEKIDLAHIERTHVLLTDLNVTHLGEAYYRMQAEQWSPNGEARERLEQLGLKHTSMSVGDIACVEGTFWMCVWNGWQALRPKPDSGSELDFAAVFEPF